MDGLKSKSFFNISNWIVMGSFLTYPLHLSTYNMINSDALDISFSKSSPPLAIIEDERIPIAEENFSDNSGQHILLKTSPANVKVFLRIASEFKSTPNEILQNEIPTPVRNLGGLTLSKNSTNIRLIKKALGIEIHETKIKFAHNPINETPTLQEPAVVAQIAPMTQVEFTPAESFEDKAEQLVEQYRNEPQTRSIATNPNDGGVHFVLAGSHPMPTTNSNGTRRNIFQEANRVAKNFANNALVNRDVPAPTIKPQSLAPMITKKLDSVSSALTESTGLLNQPPNQALIAGTLEFAGGLAMTGTQKIMVYRQIAGNKTSAGQVFLNKGQFEIYVDKPSSGMVVADMVDGDQIVGRGELLLADALKAAKTTSDLRNTKISLRPIFDQVQTSNLSAYSDLDKKQLSAKTTINDVANPKDKIIHSVIINKTEKQNYWGALNVGTSEQFFKNILYPDQNINALKDIIGATLDKAQMGIIRGAIRMMGSPVAGAKVELAADADTKPTYFNSFIPDASLGQTTANGEFAFVGVPEGMYIVKANYNGTTLAPQVVPVESGYVTQSAFDIQKPSMAEAYIFNMKNSEMMNAEIGFVGSDHFAHAQGKKLLSYSGDHGVQFIEARADDENFYSTRVTVDKSEKEILIPMIEQNWLNELVTRLKVNITPDSAIVMGTAPETSYTIELDPKAYNDDSKIVYFDRNGYTAQGATSVPVGGGFIVLNINPGMRSLFVKYQGTQAQKVVTMATDSTAINVFVSKF